MKKDIFLFITVAAALVGCKKFTDETLHGDGFKADMTGGSEGRGVGFALKEGDAGNTTGLFCSEVYADFEGKPCCALYPSSMAGVPSGRKMVVDLPAVQYYVDGTFDTNSFPAVARSDDGKTLPFMNLCGLVAVYVNSDSEFSKICITTRADEALWGEGTVDMGYTDAPQLVFNGAVTEDRKTITLKAKSSDSSSPGSEWLSIAGTVEAGGGSIPGDAVKWISIYDEKTELVMSEKVGSLTENVKVTDTAEPVALLAAGD